MVKSILLTTITFILLGNLKHDKINYRHKSLYKILRKTTGLEQPPLTEIKLPIPMNQNQEILGKYFKILDPVSHNIIRYLYIGRVNSCRAGGCSSTIGLPIKNPGYEYFDYFILFDTTATVQVVKVFNYQATHGQEITTRGWLKQFNGYTISKPMEIGKNIDVISGATVSVYAITMDVKDKTQKLQEIILRHLSAQDK